MTSTVTCVTAAAGSGGGDATPLRVPGPFALASASLLCHGPYTLSVPSATELFVFAKFLAPPVIEPPDVGPLSAGLELGIALHALLSITKSHPTVFSRRDGS